MFAIEAFVEQCREALRTDDPSATVAGVLRDALQDSQEVAAAVKSWKDNGGAAYGAIYRAADLTILHASVPPGVESPPHEHTMWAVIGVFEGQEDNVFYRLGDNGIEEVGRTAIRAGDARVLPDDTIHRIANHQPTPLQAIHVYGGDLLGTERMMWDDATGDARPFDFAAPPIRASSN
jgi:predicted metal-dependent enzyme (double-stranded beta helix superfamily)